MAKRTTANKKVKGFSEFEKAAMKERAQELLAGKGTGEEAVMARIAEMPEPDKSLSRRIHEIIMKNAPTLSPKTWYGMPSYADANGKTVCFFQSAFKFKARYATFGFNDPAKLDEGDMWPTSFALKKLTPATEKRIIELVQKAVK